jgi:hypothetical protein
MYKNEDHSADTFLRTSQKSCEHNDYEKSLKCYECVRTIYANNDLQTQAIIVTIILPFLENGGSNP